MIGKIIHKTYPVSKASIMQAFDDFDVPDKATEHVHSVMVDLYIWGSSTCWDADALPVTLIVNIDPGTGLSNGSFTVTR